MNCAAHFFGQDGENQRISTLEAARMGGLGQYLWVDAAQPLHVLFLLRIQITAAAALWTADGAADALCHLESERAVLLGPAGLFFDVQAETIGAQDVAFVAWPFQQHVAAAGAVAVRACGPEALCSLGLDIIFFVRCGRTVRRVFCLALHP